MRRSYKSSAVMFARILCAQADFIYRDMYDNPREWPNMGDLADAFDAWQTRHRDLVGMCVDIRHDFISSDREAAAFMVAYNRLTGLADDSCVVVAR